MKDIALHTEGLTKHYGDVKALIDLDLDVHRGEVFGFLGPNGAGKTTTIRTVMDEIRPTAGNASILGMDCHKQSVEIRRHIGYLPSDLALYPNLTGKDTLTYFANLRGGVEWSYVDELAERLGAQLDKKVGDLSSGNRQKVGVIQAFMNRPQLLIMDEPSSGLDPLVQREFQTMMREVVGQGQRLPVQPHPVGGAAGGRPGGHHPARQVDRERDRVRLARERPAKGRVGTRRPRRPPFWKPSRACEMCSSRTGGCNCPTKARWTHCSRPSRTSTAWLTSPRRKPTWKRSS